MGIQWQKGQFVRLRATTKFHVGELRQDIGEGDEVEYDGFTFRWNGQDLATPKFRGAVLGGWLVPVEDTTSTYVPQPAVRQVGPATPKAASAAMVTTHEEERQVGTLQHSNAKREASANPQEPRPLLPQQAGQQVQQPQRHAPVAGGLDVFLEAAHNYLQTMPPGTPIGSVLQGMPRPRNVDEADQVNAMIMEWAKNQPVVKPQREPGFIPGTRHDSLSTGGGKKGGFDASVVAEGGGVEVRAISGSQGGAVVGGIEGACYQAAHHGMDATRVTVDAINNAVAPVAAQQAPRPVIKFGQPGQAAALPGMYEPQYPGVRTASQAVEGADINAVYENGAVGDVPVSMTGDVLSDILPGAAMSRPVRAPQVMHSDADYEPPTPPSSWVPTQAPTPAPTPKKSKQAAVQEILTSWDTTRPWKERVTEAVDMYGNNPEIIDSICAMESPGVVKKIREALGQVQQEPGIEVAAVAKPAAKRPGPQPGPQPGFKGAKPTPKA